MNNLFTRLIKEHDAYSTARHSLINISSNALSKSKQAIFALHRDDQAGASLLLREVEDILLKIEKMFKKLPELRMEGSYKAALEEYVEAKLFFSFLKKGLMEKIKIVPINFETYLGGLSDVTGELTRKIVQRATEGKQPEVEKFAQAVKDIIGELVKFDLTGYLRTKYDQAKQNLRRVEEVLYDINIRKK